MKQAGDVSPAGDGSQSVPITLTITNAGDDKLAGLRLQDVLDIFRSGSLVAVDNLAADGLTLNPGYDGLNDIDLLDGTDRLEPGATASVTFTVRFDPGDEQDPFVNKAVAAAIGKSSGDEVTARDTASFRPLPPPPPPQPGVEIRIQAGEVIPAGDGSQSVPITLTVTNAGEDTLTALQVQDDLDIFRNGSLVGVDDVAADGLTLNPGFDGLTDINVLDGTDRLEPGATASLTFTVRFDPADEQDPFDNTVVATATGEVSGEDVTASDTASFQPLPPEPPPQAAIAVVKLAGEVTALGDGRQVVPITLTVTNAGEDKLTALQVQDDLDIFRSGSLVAIDDLAAPGLTLNPGYDGLTDTNLLAGTDQLEPGATASLTFTLRFDPGDEQDPILNTVVATATGEASGEDVTASDSASFQPLPPAPPPQAAIAVAKQAGEVTALGDGNQGVPITLTVTNAGDDTLTALQLRDDLGIFRSGSLVAVDDLAAPGLTLNPGYDGLTDTNLLDGTDQLEPGATASVTFTLRFDPGDEQDPFLNTVVATATGEASGEDVTASDTASFQPLPPEPPPQAAIAVAKLAGEVTALGDGRQGVPITLTVTNVGEDKLTALQVQDDLDIFRTGSLVAVDDVVADGLTPNPGYDGLTDINVLDGTDQLEPGATASLTFTLRFDPAGEQDPFVNTVIATATGEASGEDVTASDTASFQPLPPEPPPQAAVDIRIEAGEVTDRGDGSQSVPITLTVTNTGEDTLTALQVEDDLDIFRTGSLVAVDDLAAPGLTLNPGYDGLTDTNLLAGTDQLETGATASLTFTVRFDPADEQDPFLNTVVASATGEASGEDVTASDIASFQPLPPEPPPQAAVDIRIEAGEVADRGDGSQSVPITLTVTNTGDDTLVLLQVQDDLDIFRSGSLVAVDDLASPDLGLNPGFDGLDEINLLDGTDRLEPGDEANVTFTVRFDPAEEQDPFPNTVIATATGEASGEDVFASDTAAIEPLSPPPPLLPSEVSVTKQADRTEVVHGDVVGYDVRVTNLSDGNLTDVSITDLPPPGFIFIEESVQLIRAGADGVVNTADDIRTTLATTGRSPIAFAVFDLGPEETVVVRYAMRVTTGVTDGEYSNRVTVGSDGRAPATTSAAIEVVGDPIFEKTTLIGKVYDDKNENFMQDAGEPGVPGVRIGTVSGLLVETDAAGRFHIAAVDVPRFERGINFIIKIDESSLPDGTRIISDNPRVIRLTQATMSKMNFAVRLPGGLDESCYRQCYDVTPQRGQAGIAPVNFASGETDVPADFSLQLRTLLQAYSNEQRARLKFVGHTDNVAPVGALARELGAGGEEGNIRLSRLRALDVCQHVRTMTDIETDCSLVEGRGSANPVASNETEEGRALNRRVEVEIEYFDIEPVSSLQDVEPAQCRSMAPERGLLDAVLSREPRITRPQTVCATYPRPPPALSTATARAVTISGGRFGCNRLAAEVLPGRDAEDGQLEKSVVFVSASERPNPPRDGTRCEGAWGDNIRSGEYPVEIRTERNSVLWVTSAGDVIRRNDPENDERIVVTPFRDDTDVAAITALRIANEGSEPAGDGDALAAVTPDHAVELRRSTDSLFVDPRLDVLALDPPFRSPTNEQRKIRFAAYTNYRAFTDSYQLDVYGLRNGGYSRELLASISADDIGFGRTLDFTYSGDQLSPFAKLEYVLRAFDCQGKIDGASCHSDETEPRIAVIHDTDPGPDARRDPRELWGQSNLAQQRIPIVGGRARTSGIAAPGAQAVNIGGRTVPVGRNERFVLEEHLPFTAAESANRDNSDSAGGLRHNVIGAGATNVSVAGGPFGCAGEIAHELPGRENKNDPIGTALTVVADPGPVSPQETECEDGSTAGQYPIVVSTAEGSVIHVTAAGDVIRQEHPAEGTSNQHIVVTPFRDDTNNSVISALRISNEGVSSQSQAPGPESFSAATIDDDDENYRFVVALANLTIGQNNVSGAQDLLAADDHFDGSTFADGRLAVYAKTRFREKYLVTAQLDSTEDELRNLTDNLQSKDPRRIFRQLDPNRNYALYGDDSTTTTDVDTQGAFYLRVDWDDNTALWGNYNTGMTDTEFMQYNRSLYGAKLRHFSQKATSSGDARTDVTLFASEPQSQTAHVTFHATGGSLYFLRDTNIVEGSEKVWIEVRRRDTEQVVEREVLIEGRDYEIDALQGRITLARPLSRVVAERATSIIRSTPVEGDEVFLLVDYEHVPAGFAADNLTYGGRARAWLTDTLAVGATAINDEREGSDHEMQGVDLTLRKSERTYLRAEIAASEARQSDPNLISYDGGLSFQSRTSDGVDGRAYGLDARIDFADFSETLTGDIRGWHKSRDADFSVGRLGQGVDVDDSGIEAHLQLSDNLDVAASYTDLERELIARERVARVQVDGEFGKLSAGVELRYEDIDLLQADSALPRSNLNAAAADGASLLVGARFGYALDSASTIYATVQTAPGDDENYEANSLVSIGMNRQLSGDTVISVDASDGDRGSAITAGIDYTTAAGVDFNFSGGVGSGAVSEFGTSYSIADGHELYGSYTVDPDRTEAARNLLTLGQRRAFGNNLSLFTESTFGRDDRYAGVAHAFGLGFEGVNDWRFIASMQFGENDREGVDFERKALSLGAFLRRDSLKLSTRVEVREDKGVGVDERQYVSSNSFTKVVDADRRWLGQLNFSWTDDHLNGGRVARFVEFEIGHTYRPGSSDRLNLITKYSFLYDLPTAGQDTVRPDEQSHLLAVDGIFELSQRWELGGKLALRKGERRANRDAGGWTGFGLRMAAVRARFAATSKWDALAEYRWLSDMDGDSDRHGALAGVYRHLGDNLQIGVGFNFTDFNDELLMQDYESRGWFIDIVGKY